MNCEPNDKIDHIIALSLTNYGKSNSALLSSIDTSNINLGDKFKKSILRMENLHYTEKSRQRVQRVSFRVAFAIMLIVTMLFATMMSVSAIREAIFNVISDWYENYVVVHFEPNSPVTSTQPKYIEVVKKPTYIPDGVVAKEVETQTMVGIDYYDENGNFVLAYNQMLLKNHNYYLNNTSAKIQDIEIADFNGLCISYNESNIVYFIWNDGYYFYALHSEILNEAELLKIAESVK